MVHNLRAAKDVTEATQLFSRQVMMSYDGEPSHLGDLIFTADLGNGTLPVRHVGLCYEFSEAGDAFNAENRQYLLLSFLAALGLVCFNRISCLATSKRVCP